MSGPVGMATKTANIKQIIKQANPPYSIIYGFNDMSQYSDQRYLQTKESLKQMEKLR